MSPAVFSFSLWHVTQYWLKTARCSWAIAAPAKAVNIIASRAFRIIIDCEYYALKPGPRQNARKSERVLQCKLHDSGIQRSINLPKSVAVECEVWVSPS